MKRDIKDRLLEKIEDVGVIVLLGGILLSFIFLR